MKNYTQKGHVISVVLTAACVSGVPFLVGELLVVPTKTGAIGDTVACAVEGVFEITKLTADVVTQGVKLYWDDTNKRLTITASTHKHVGYAWAPASGSVSTVECKLGL